MAGEYNCPNYFEQDTGKLVIGGALEIKSGATVTGLPCADNVAESTATTVAQAVTSINAILTALKAAGLMKADT